jgi:hypothetical protein
MLQINKIIGFSFFLFLNLTLNARELVFLPSYILGEAPEALRKKDNLSEGVSDLLAFYARENFQAEITEPDRIRNFLESTDDELGRKPSRGLINGICSEFEPDYLVHSELDFESKGSVYTEIYNCRGKLTFKQESSLEGDFYQGMENHAKRLFIFLNQKNRPSFQAHSTSEEEIIFAVDTSGSISREAGKLINSLENILGRTNLKIGLATISPKGYKLYRPSRNPQEVRTALRKIRFSGELGLEDLGNWLLRINNELKLSGQGKRKFILLTDARIGKGNPYKFITSLQNISRSGYAVHLITGSFYDGKDASIYTKASKASNGRLHQILHSRIIGTPKGFYTLFLQNRRLYYEEGRSEILKNFNPESAIAISETQVFSQVEFPHPSNMADVFSKLTGQKAIQQDPIQSNVPEIIEKVVQVGSELSYLKNYSKVLVKVGAQSIWIQLQNAEESWLQSDQAFRVVFRVDKNSALGFSNLPEESQLYKETVPLLLSLTPPEIKKNLENSKSGFLECFLQGKVLEIR